MDVPDAQSFALLCPPLAEENDLGDIANLIIIINGCGDAVKLDNLHADPPTSLFRIHRGQTSRFSNHERSTPAQLVLPSGQVTSGVLAQLCNTLQCSK